MEKLLRRISRSTRSGKNEARGPQRARTRACYPQCASLCAWLGGFAGGGRGANGRDGFAAAPPPPQLRTDHLKLRIVEAPHASRKGVWRMLYVFKLYVMQVRIQVRRIARAACAPSPGAGVRDRPTGGGGGRRKSTSSTKTGWCGAWCAAWRRRRAAASSQAAKVPAGTCRRCLGSRHTITCFAVVRIVIAYTALHHPRCAPAGNAGRAVPLPAERAPVRVSPVLRVTQRRLRRLLRLLDGAQIGLQAVAPRAFGPVQVRRSRVQLPQLRRQLRLLLAQRRQALRLPHSAAAAIQARQAVPCARVRRASQGQRRCAPTRCCGAVLVVAPASRSSSTRRAYGECVTSVASSCCARPGATARTRCATSSSCEYACAPARPANVAAVRPPATARPTRPVTAKAKPVPKPVSPGRPNCVRAGQQRAWKLRAACRRPCKPLAGGYAHLKYAFQPLQEQARVLRGDLTCAAAGRRRQCRRVSQRQPLGMPARRRRPRRSTATRCAAPRPS